MEALFTKYFWVIKTLGIAAACGLAASAITTQVGATFLLDPDMGVSGGDTDGEGEGDSEDGPEGDEEGDEVEDPRLGRRGFSFDESALTGTSAQARAKEKQRVADRISKRNIFCPTCEPEEPEPGEAGAGEVDAAGRPTGPLIQPGETKSKLPLRLMATMEAEDPEDSFATILDEEVGVAGLFGRGDVIRDGVIVMSVDQAIVHLRNNATLEYIELGDEPPKAPIRTASSATKPAVPPPKNDRSIEGAEEAINCANENSCTVDRAFVEKLMQNPALLAKQARIVAKQKDGEIQGYKLYGIRRGSLPKLLGLKNGDMVTSVNGEELKSMDKAMALYTKLRRASNLSVSIERRGEIINKEIAIQ